MELLLPLLTPKAEKIIREGKLLPANMKESERKLLYDIYFRDELGRMISKAGGAEGIYLQDWKFDRNIAINLAKKGWITLEPVEVL